jgi:hypothetical protein
MRGRKQKGRVTKPCLAMMPKALHMLAQRDSTNQEALSAYLLSWTLNRLGFDVGFIVEASPAGTRIRGAGFMRLLQVAVVLPTLS